MQQLHSSLWTEHMVRMRARAWWLARCDGTRGDGTFIADLATLEASGGRGLRVALPPDRLEPQRYPIARCRPRAWAWRLPSPCRAPHDDDLRAAACVHAQVLAYQWVPALALLSGRVRRLLLADAVGMGKTIQAALVLAEVHARMATARSLVVVPAGLVAQWAREVRTRTGVPPRVLDGDTLARRTAAAGVVALAEPGELCLMSLDMLRQPEIAALVERHTWQLLVVDEAHLLAPGTARSAAIERVAAVACQVLLITATPRSGDDRADRHLLAVGRRPGEGDRILLVSRGPATVARPPLRSRIVRLRAAGDELRLHARLAAYVARARADASGPRQDDIVAAGHLAALLLRRRASSSLRAFIRTAERRLRLLREVAGARAFDSSQRLLPLGDGIDEDEWLATPAWRDVRDERRCLEQLVTEARRLAGPGARLRWLARWAARVHEPLLVFTEYLDTLHAARVLLAPLCRVAVLHGGQTPAQRALSVEHFTDGPADVLLATDAGSEGLNLHARCRLMVHLEVPWSPRRLAQRNGRLDRIGQVRQVRVLLPVIHGTSDENDVQRLEARKTLAQRVGGAPDDGLMVVASPRRERLAAAAVAATGRAADSPARASRRAPDLRERPVTITRVAARRGAALRRRWGLPRCDAAALAAINVAGGHPMLRWRRWMAVAVEGCRPDEGDRASVAAGVAPWTDATLERALRALPVVRRFEARATRASARWMALDTAARGSLPPTPEPDLFLSSGSGAAGVAARDVNTPAHDAEARGEGPSHEPAAVRLAQLRLLTWRR